MRKVGKSPTELTQMIDPSLSSYAPLKIWTWDKENGGRFANINRPVAGATHDKDLPVGRHPLYG